MAAMETWAPTRQGLWYDSTPRCLHALAQGLAPNYVKVVPSIAIAFVTYEQVKEALGGWPLVAACQLCAAWLCIHGPAMLLKDGQRG